MGYIHTLGFDGDGHDGSTEDEKKTWGNKARGSEEV